MEELLYIIRFIKAKSKGQEFTEVAPWKVPPPPPSKLGKKPAQPGAEYKSLFFPAGLLIVLMLAYGALEFKTYKMKYEIETIDVDSEIEEEIPITRITPPPPPPPPPEPIIAYEFEVVEDDADVEEAFFAETDTDEDEFIEDVEVYDYGDDEEIFVPEYVPPEKPKIPICNKKYGPNGRPNKHYVEVLPDGYIADNSLCEETAPPPSVFTNPPSVNGSDRNFKAFNAEWHKHIRKHFSYPQIAQELGQQGRVTFIAEFRKDGSVVVLKIRGPYSALEKEARRIIEKFRVDPPTDQYGKPISVQFPASIVFRLQ